MFSNGCLPIWKEMVEYGDHAFDKGKYEKALQEYDKALQTTPRHANLKISRAQTLVCMGRLTDALDEFGEAYKIDSTNDRLWHRMSLFHLRLGAIVLAEFFMRKASEASRLDLRVKITKVKDRLVRAEKARKEDNWIAALREINAIIAEGVDFSQLIMAFRAEMLLRLDLVEEAKETLKRAPELNMSLLAYVYFSGMPLLAYLWAISAQIQLAQGRGEIAVADAAKARGIASSNDEISAIHKHVRLVHTGNKHYDSGDYLIALKEYMVELKYAKPNVSLLINLATCHWQLEMWENCIEICNQVLQIRPDNNNVLAQRADSYAKLGKWAESVKDYEAAKKIYPGNAKIFKKIIKGLKESQAALKKSQVTELAETPVEAQDAVNEPQVTELAETLVEAQDAVRVPQVTELSETRTS